MATIVNARDVQLQLITPRVATVAAPSNVTTDFDQVNGTHKPSDNADVAQVAIIAGITVTGGGIVISGGGAIKGGKTAYGSGTGFFIGYSGGYKFDIGSPSNYLRWTGSALEVAGDITSTGVGVFEGSNSTSDGAAALVVNSSLGTGIGVRAYATTGISAAALWGSATGGLGVNGAATTGTGVVGQATGSGGNGVWGTSSHSAGIGVKAANTGGGTALSVFGKMVLDNSTFTWNTKVISAPGGSTTKFLRDDGTWTDLTSLLKYISSGSTATTGAVTLGQAVGFLLIDTYGAAGQVKIPYYAV